nr:GGDEF domain-containing protein [Eubacterium sp.]
MFSNGRKTIGLFIFNPQLEFQSQVCEAMAEATKKLGYNLAVFSSYGCYGQNPLYHEGEMQILTLPDYSDFAGIILALDTIDKDEARQIILDQITRKATCPVVSLRVPVEGASNILFDETNVMEGVIRHIIEEHGKKDIAFMTGTKGRHDAEARLECFRRIMDEYGYPVGENRVYYGNFWKGHEKAACDLFLQDGNKPEAILCANDKMALMVIDELYSRNLSVPEDILVTGYDGVDEGAFNSPALTTMKADFPDMAYRAVELIDKHQEDNEIEDVYVTPQIVVRESCGCEIYGKDKAKQQRCLNHKEIAEQENIEMQFSFMTIDFSELDDMDQLHLAIKKYIYNIEGFQHYYIAFRDDIESGKDILKGYTERMHVRVAFRYRADQEIIDYSCMKRELLPKELTGDEPQCFFFFPLHFLDRTFGYEVYGFGERPVWKQPYVRWNIAISNAIQGILEQRKMNNLLNELEHMYIQDVLTGLYNRRGFEKYARMQFSKARAKDSMICVIGIDMDGLKPINDIYGHHEGDSALRAVGYAIQEAGQPGQIAARTGGDEFEVIFPCEDEEEVVKWCETFEQSLENFNKKSVKPYDVYASWGYKVGVPTANDTIETYMNESDDIMYRNKVANKLRRNQELR